MPKGAWSDAGWVCTRCGTVGLPRRITKGSIGIELMLWLLFLFPGLLYSVWRLSTRYDGCRACGPADVIPSSSPRAQQMRSGGA